MRPQKTVRQRLVLPQQSEQQMLGFDVRRPKLTGLIPREENHAPRLLRIAFEHVPPSPIGKYTRPKQRAGCAACDLLPRFRLLAKGRASIRCFQCIRPATLDPSLPRVSLQKVTATLQQHLLDEP